MTDTLTVATHFEDLSQFAAGLVDRVDEDRLILYGPSAFPDGERVNFAVLLVDGSPALEGQARILATVDGGEERDPSARFDIYLDGLELGGMSQAVYERIVLARQSLTSGEPPTGEIDVGELERMEAEAAAAAEPPDPFEAEAEPPLEAADEDWGEPAAEADMGVAQMDDFGGESTVVAADPQALADAYEAERERAAADEQPAAEEPAEAEDWAEPMEAPAEDWAEPVASEPPAAAEPMEAPAEDWAEPAADAEDAEDWAEPADDDFAPVDTGDFHGPGAQAPHAAAPDAGTVAALAGEASIPPPPPVDPGGFRLAAAGAVLTRPSREPAWWPAPAERPEAREVSGYFAYEGELPIPSTPPHPDLDAGYRVGPAPRPQAGAESAEPVAHAASEASCAADDDDFDASATDDGYAAAEVETAVELESADATSEVELAADDPTSSMELPESAEDADEFEEFDAAAPVAEAEESEVDFEDFAAIDMEEAPEDVEPV